MSQFDFTKLFGTAFTANLPSTANFPFDLKSLVETQKKNLEAITEAQKLFFEGLQAIGARQSEILSELVAENSSLVKEIVIEGTPEQKVARQADLIKKHYETSVANFRELADIAGNSSKEAAELLNKRITASLTELKSSLVKKESTTGTAVAVRKKAA